MTTTQRPFLVTALGSVLVVATPAAAVAGGFTVARFGGEDGHAASDHVTTIYYNPAGIALGKGTRIYLEGTFAYRTVDYDRDPDAIDNPNDPTGTPEDAIDANAGPAHLANVLVSPFAGAAFGFGGFSLAVGVYAPFGGQASWDKNEAYRDNEMYPGAVDGPQRWANIEGAQRSLYGTVAGAWASPDGSVAFGVGLNVISSNLSLVRARQATGTDDVIGEGRSLLEADDLTFGLGIGAMWAPNETSRLGISYQSQPGFGEMTLEGTLSNRFPAGETVQDVVLLQQMPDIVRVAAEIQASPQMVVRLAADWQRWSEYANQCLLPAEAAIQRCTFNRDGTVDEDAGGSPEVIVNIPRDWRDTFGARVGVGYALGEGKHELAGSLSYDSNAVPDETMDPSLFDMNKFILQVGGTFALADQFYVQATAGHVFYMTRTTEARGVYPEPPSRNPDMAGTYASTVTYLMLGLGARL